MQSLKLQQLWFRPLLFNFWVILWPVCKDRAMHGKYMSKHDCNSSVLIFDIIPRRNLSSIAPWVGFTQTTQSKRDKFISDGWTRLLRPGRIMDAGAEPEAPTSPSLTWVSRERAPAESSNARLAGAHPTNRRCAPPDQDSEPAPGIGYKLWKDRLERMEQNSIEFGQPWKKYERSRLFKPSHIFNL